VQYLVAKIIIKKRNSHLFLTQLLVAHALPPALSLPPLSRQPSAGCIASQGVRSHPTAPSLPPSVSPLPHPQPARLLLAYCFSKQIQGQGYIIVFKMEMEYFY